MNPVAVRAGRLFDSKSGQMLTRQVVLIQGDRIVTPRVVEHVAAIGGQHDRGANMLGGIGKGAHLVARGRSDE
jgi:hypothetical protein